MWLPIATSHRKLAILHSLSWLWVYVSRVWNASFGTCRLSGLPTQEDVMNFSPPRNPGWSPTLTNLETEHQDAMAVALHHANGGAS